MKKQFYAIVAFMLLVVPMVGAQTLYNGDIKIKQNQIEQIGNQVVIDMDMTISGDIVDRYRTLIVTPIIKSSNKCVVLPDVMINGRSRQLVYNQAIKMGYFPTPPYAVVLANGQATTVNYKVTVPYQEWMADAKVMLREILCCNQGGSCCCTELIAEFIKLENLTIEVAYLAPANDQTKGRTDVGSAFIEFPVGKSNLLTDFRSNPKELTAIRKSIQTVKDLKDATITSVDLTGYCSPEGSWASNSKLAEARSNTVRDYIEKEYGFAQNIVKAGSVPEDWAGLAKLVEKSDMANASEALAIINSNVDPDQKDRQIATLAGGRPYRYMLANYYPSLRRVDYKIDYTIRPFSPEEGRSVIKTNPKDLTPYEMYQVAKTYETGSDQFNEVLEIAVSTYPDNDVAKLNAAAVAIGQKDIAKAKNLIKNTPDSPAKYNNLGVIAILEGEYQMAEDNLKKAEAAGITQATQNLKALSRKR